MRILVLGGSGFLSRQVAVEALRRGHEVTCACRGVTGSPPEGARHVGIDRTKETDPAARGWAELRGVAWDAVVDVAGRASWVAAAVEALGERAGHWSFVSTVNVYADLSQRGGGVDDTPLLDPAGGEEDPAADPTAYGREKVACEQTVLQAMGERAFVVRPGLIGGPGDPSGRFTSWPARMARGGRVLAPTPGSAPAQLIDVRDLAGWLVDAAERRTGGVFDGVGPQLTRREFLRQVAVGVDTPVELVWADPEALETLDVLPWAGPRSVAMWVPLPELVGMMARDDTASVQAGLVCRPVAETARDTLAWLRETPDAEVTGLSEAEERDVLAGLTLKPRSRVVHAALVRAGVPGRIVQLPGAASTAPLAAAALGCDVGAIANSLVFWCDERPLLVLASGAHRVDTARLAERLGRGPIVRATSEQVRSATGQAIGGVAPVGHPEPLETVVDVSLGDHEQVWAAGGTPHTLFPTSYQELVTLTGGRPVEVT